MRSIFKAWVLTRKPKRHGKSANQSLVAHSVKTRSSACMANPLNHGHLHVCEKTKASGRGTCHEDRPNEEIFVEERCELLSVEDGRGHSGWSAARGRAIPDNDVRCGDIPPGSLIFWAQGGWNLALNPSNRSTYSTRSQELLRESNLSTVKHEPM